MQTISRSVLAAVHSCSTATDVEPHAAVRVVVEPTKGDDGQFSDMLKVKLSKRRGRIKAAVYIVCPPEDAHYVLKASI